MTKEFNEQYNYWHLKSDEGMVITSWNEGDDILDYTSSREMYCPVNTDFSRYHEIPETDDAAYLEQQMEILKNMK